MTQPELLEYPNAPGYKEQTTSKEAATRFRPKDSPIRKLVLESLAKDGPANADEMAQRLKLDPRNVHPRISQLFKLGKVADTGMRRPSLLGSPSIVWRIA